MENQSIARLMEEGAAFFSAGEAGRRLTWYTNPAWTGVSLADLAPGADTKGSFTSHFVRIRKGCEVPDHLHESQWEWNVILDGHGTIHLDEREIPFNPGDTFTTPPGVRHAVVADMEDIALLAVFVPGPR
jgi:quercetin dioxygenase-like cupin family protein